MRWVNQRTELGAFHDLSFDQAPLWLEKSVESPKSEARVVSWWILFHDIFGSITCREEGGAASQELSNTQHH